MIKNLQKITKQELEHLYIDKQFSINEISKKLNCGYWQIWKTMKQLKIKARTLSEANTLNNVKRKILIPEKTLKQLYLNKRFSSLQISKLYNCHYSVILNRLKEYNIKRRDAVESNTKYHKKNFDGSQEDKSYLLGFALGDLNVRKPNNNGRTIVLQGNSTVPEQISLIKSLFKKYGPIQIRDVIGFGKEKRVTVNLNSSFEFLLYKKDKIPSWILQNRSTFFSFLAGYVDAEGHIKTNIPTLLTINSYDKNILKQIHKYLIKFGIESAKLRISAKKGYFSPKHTIPYKKNVWQVGVYSKQFLLELFKNIKPYLKHQKKIDAMDKSIKQICQRNQRYGYQRMRYSKKCIQNK